MQNSSLIDLTLFRRFFSVLPSSNSSHFWVFTGFI